MVIDNSIHISATNILGIDDRAMQLMERAVTLSISSILPLEVIQ